MAALDLPRAACQLSSSGRYAEDLKNSKRGRRGKERRQGTPAGGSQDKAVGERQEEMCRVKVVVEIIADPLKLLTGLPREVAQVWQEEEEEVVVGERAEG